MKELTRSTAIAHNHNIAISGASRKFNYRASFAYKNAQGIAKNSNREEMIAGCRNPPPESQRVKELNRLHRHW